MLAKQTAMIIAFKWLIICGLTFARADQPIVLFRGELATELAPHRIGHVYAPEVHRHGDMLLMWYGGQGADGHDRIHLAESTDGAIWFKKGVVIENGTANHVNDPSVVRVGERWWMFYTIAEKGEQDEIAAATSSDGRTWKEHGIVLPTGNENVWDSGKVGRPSVIFENEKFHMWYDGQPASTAVEANDELCQRVEGEGRAVGYAESADGLTWVRRPAPVFHHGAGAVQVTKLQQRYIMVFESRKGTRWASSVNRFDWHERGLLLTLSGETHDAFGHVTPFLHVDIDGNNCLYFGAAARQTWDGNAIACAAVEIP